MYPQVMFQFSSSVAEQQVAKQQVAKQDSTPHVARRVRRNWRAAQNRNLAVWPRRVLPSVCEP